VRIGMLGGTGPAGRALAARLADSGFDVVIGSRSSDRAVEMRDKIVQAWPDHDLPIDGADNETAAAADVIVVATPWDAAGATAASVAPALTGKVVISMANALAKVGDEFQPLVPPRGSVAANIQAAVPDALVSASFHHVPAKELGDLSGPVESDVLICSDHAAAMQTTTEIVSAIRDLRPLDAGQMSNAAPIEAFTAVLLQLNVRYKTRAAVKFTGIDV